MKSRKIIENYKKKVRKMGRGEDCVIDVQIHAELKQTMGDIFEDVITVFIQETESLVEKIENQICMPDNTNLFMSAHTLKSSSLMVGAKRMSDICRTIEDSVDQHSKKDTQYIKHDLNQLGKALKEEFQQVKNALQHEISSYA